MLQIRKREERGHADHGWLDTYHTFSFNTYHDERHMGFRSLRVINEDRVQPGEGFGTHPHRDMEIISYVLDGALEHKDSMGTGSVIRPGEIQRMSAGRGVTHSEFNASRTDQAHFLQIWLLPIERGIAPSYEQRLLDRDAMNGKLCLIASPEGREESVTIHTDSALYAGRFDDGQSAKMTLADGRFGWVQCVRGRVRVNGIEMRAGDGAALSDEPTVRIEGIDRSEILVFDLA